MSDMKRIALSTIPNAGAVNSDINIPLKKSAFTASTTALLQGPQTSSGSSLAPTAASVSPTTTPHEQQLRKTFRIELELFEPNANWFPEFNYTKLVHTEKKKLKKISKVNGFSDPFDENDDDDVARIAKEFEAKYGGSTRSRCNKKDDYYDKGAGYDESDSFIDNTEAYDEIIPAEVETVEGGFYINSGALEFTHLSNYERPENTTKMPKAKKRSLSTSSSSEDELGKDGNKKEDTNDVEASPKGTVPIALNTANKIKNTHSEKKIKTADDTCKEINTKSRHKDTKLDKIQNQSDESHEKDGDECEEDEDEAMEEEAKGATNKELISNASKIVEKEKHVKTTTIKDMLKAKRDNFRKMQEGESKGKLTNGENVKESDLTDSSDETSGAESDSESEPDEKRIRKDGENDVEKMKPSDVKLPPDLSVDLVKDIEELKSAAKSMAEMGKSFQFDDQLTELFLRIDDFCSYLEKSIRNQVYAHLEFQLSLSKYYLLRKVKSLRIKQEKSKTKKAFMKLRKSVAEIMPSILLTYEMNCKKIEEERSLIATQSECEKLDSQLKHPKKKFPWNETLRNLLYELFQVRWTSFAVLRTKRESFDDFVNNFLKQKVVPIWPVGWMKFEDLQKELEKRKISAKKPKENKKPGENTLTSKKKPIEETDASIVKKSGSNADSSKSILSNSNSVAVVSTKDLVVTITTSRLDKKCDVSNSNTQQIPSSQQKIQKHSSGKTNNSNISSTSTNQNRAVNKAATQSINKSRLICSDKSINSTEVNSNLSTESTNLCSSNVLSPTKRATDHSINSIMSIATLNSTLQQHSNNESASPSSTPLSSSTKNSLGKNNSKIDTAKTHIITVDKLKSTSDIINTTNQLLNNNIVVDTKNTITNISNVASKEGLIRIRSVANVNSSIEKGNKKDAVIMKKKSNVIADDKESGSESDDCKIVDEYSFKKSKISIKSNPYRGNSSSGSRSVSPNTNLTLTVDDVRRTAGHVFRSGNDGKDSELDVNQIMRALKELEAESSQKHSK